MHFNHMEFNRIAAASRSRLQERNAHKELISLFESQVRKVYDGYSGIIPWDEISNLKTNDYVELDDLPDEIPNANDFLRRLVVIKLNGGLGSGMGLERAKTLIPVKEGLNFLLILKEQTLALRRRTGIPIPLLFMNSFKSQRDTLSEPGITTINQDAPGRLPADFLQNMVPRLNAEDLHPYGDGTSDEDWCPPGHGDIYAALRITGLLDAMLAAGYRTAFIANGDNLGASVEERILEYIFRQKLDFCIEMTPKTHADRKGGVFFRRLSPDGSPGRMELLEVAQVEPEHIAEFEDIHRFSHFNINNLYVNLETLRDRLRKGVFDLSLILNRKIVSGEEIIQLETAMGSAIGAFENTRAISVDRSRFAPVKSCNDLLTRRSDAYILDREAYFLYKNPDALKNEPNIRLDDRYYKKLPDFDRLVTIPPSLLDCVALQTEGPIHFDAPLSIKGSVVLRNPSSIPRKISELGRNVLEDEEFDFA